MTPEATLSSDQAPGEGPVSGPLWYATGCSVRGAAHRRKGRRNQDALAIWPTRGLPSRRRLIAVADGHGADPYVRSEMGALLACEVAEQAARAMVSHLDRLERHRNAVREFTRWLDEDLARFVVRRWNELVTADLRVDPLRGGQETGIQAARGGSEPPKAGDVRPGPGMSTSQAAPATGGASAPPVPLEEAIDVYGSTLIFALLTEYCCVFFQLGDGTLHVATESGEILAPLPAEPLNLGTDATSLVMPDAWRYVRIAVVPTEVLHPRLVLAATDGLATSFPEATGMTQFIDGVGQLASKTPSGELDERLETALTRYTSEGSGDDITVAVTWRSDQRIE
ncbi:protein phosphatase 2C domain-containing protein [Streptomyces sp. GbtcB7]|uniref:protein phosphatase 2C domain-containing protein n=1 Tax=Streptomyces sp. GbtcB7 TaxID=2824752 RepID=UPI001C310630|nr:protein phosphatase 2C domain-containing protein [Streptomyces sp. GbtcB7]